MKWACIIILIIDLVLVGFASFRYLTVPKSEVEAKKQQLVESVMEMESQFIMDVKSPEERRSEASNDVELPDNWNNNIAPSSDEVTSDDFDYKNIDMSDDEVWEYDDQYIKEERMSRAKENMNAVFGTK